MFRYLKVVRMSEMTLSFNSDLIRLLAVFLTAILSMAFHSAYMFLCEASFYHPNNVLFKIFIHFLWLLLLYCR